MNWKVVGLMASLALLGACADQTSTGATTGAGATSATAGGVLPGSQEDLVANVGDRVFYALDSSSLSSDARTTLDRQAAWLARYPQVSIQMAGNCDERGTAEYNLALGQKRAEAVRKQLALVGVPEGQMEAVSLGKEKPRNDGHDETAWAENRRADFVYQAP